MSSATFVARLASALESLMPPGVQLQGSDEDLLVLTQFGQEPLQLGHNVRLKIEDGLPLGLAIQHAVMDIMNELQDIVTLTLP